jgi:DNA-binding SARP family transcriptional activator
MAVRQDAAGGSPDDQAEGGMLAVTMFGSLSVQVDGSPASGMTLRKADRLLAFLTLEAGRPVACAGLASTFWPATESMDSLHHGFSALRRALGTHGQRVHISSGFASINLAGASVDVTAFDAAVARNDPESLATAVALYRGPLLRGWPERWVTAHRERRRKQYLDCLRALAAAARDADDLRSAADWARRLANAAPGDEHTWELLMETLLMAGERTAAIEAYEQCRAHLGARYGIAPSDAMVRMQQSIRLPAAPPRPQAPTDPAAVQAPSSGGALPTGEGHYIVRSQDALLTEALQRRESIILIRGPRHSGKSSLLARGMAGARAGGARAVYLDVSTLSEDEVGGMEELCAALAGRLAMALDLDESPQELWRSHLGPGANLERYMVKRVLSTDDAPLAWALDGADRLLGLRYSDEFFSLLRLWHEKRAFEPDRPWDRLTIAIVCATEPHLYISDLNRSPFNVGARVDMTDFAPDEVAELARRYGLVRLDIAALQGCHTLLGGHPYLTARAFRDMSALGFGWPEYAGSVRSDFGPFGDLIQGLRQSIEADPELTQAVACLTRGAECSERGFFRLRSAGVLAGETRAAARWRCGLYAERLSGIGTG